MLLCENVMPNNGNEEQGHPFIYRLHPSDLPCLNLIFFLFSFAKVKNVKPR